MVGDSFAGNSDILGRFGQCTMKIFISHSTQEKVLADALANVIRAAFPSAEVRYSSDFSIGGGIDAGDRWHPWILNQLRTSKVTLVVLSHQSASSPWLLWEAGAASGVALATGEKTTVIPCLYDLAPEKVPAPLSIRQSVKADEREGILQILAAIARRNRRSLLHTIRTLFPVASSQSDAAGLSFLPPDTHYSERTLEAAVP